MQASINTDIPEHKVALDCQTILARRSACACKLRRVPKDRVYHVMQVHELVTQKGVQSHAALESFRPDIVLGDFSLPRLGGLAVLVSSGVVLLAGHYGLFGPYLRLGEPLASGIAFGLVPVVAISFVDDLLGVRARWKALAHLAGAILAVHAGVVLNPEIHFLGQPLAIGFLAGGDRRGLFVGLGLVLASLGGGELALREHFTGFRSHTTLLAGLCGFGVAPLACRRVSCPFSLGRRGSSKVKAAPWPMPSRQWD